MTQHAIYLVNGAGPDTAIQKGLKDAGCEVRCTHSISETLQKLREETVSSSPHLGLKPTPGITNPGETSTNTNLGKPLVLIANIQAGAIPLLTLLSEQGIELPPTMIYDEEGNDIHNIIRALQLGVREYVLATDPESQRRLNARILAERVRTAPLHESATTPVANMVESAPMAGFEWDPIGRVIHVGDSYLRLSPVEGRIFDLLLINRDRTVPIDELAEHVLSKSDLEAGASARRLRPHVMRLRRKLERYPALANRIVNMRGTGYMLI